MNDFKSKDGDEKNGMKSLTVMIGSKNTFLVAFILIDFVFLGFAWLAWTSGFTVLLWLSIAAVSANISIQVRLYRDPKGGLSFMRHAVEDGFGNAIGKSEVQEHNSFLRYQVANNILFVIILFFAGAMVGIRYM